MDKLPSNNDSEKNKRWGEAGLKADAQLNEIYANKYDQAGQLARDRMMALERQLNSAQNDEESKKILGEIEAERNHIIEMNDEAEARRSDNIKR